MALSIQSPQVAMGKMRAPAPEPMPSYETVGKVAWITLDQPDHMNAIHTVGDVLRGRAYIEPKDDTTITSLAIYFRCKVATGLTERNGGIPKIHRWKSLIFSHVIELINSSTGTVLSGEHSFPFAFTIPSATPPNEAAKVFPHDSTAFDVAGGHSLPPSFHQKYASHLERIVYYLEVLAKCKGRFNGDIQDKMPIHFSPARSTLNPELRPKPHEHSFKRQSKLLDPESGEVQSKFKEGMNKLFSSSRPEPVVHFSLTGTVPSVVYVGGPVPIQIALEYLSPGSTAPEVPDVHLCNVLVRLTAWTIFRVPVRGYFRPSHILRTFDDKIDIVNAKLTEQPVIPCTSQTIQLDQMIDGLEIKPEVKPSFKSWAIGRWYEIKATVEVSVAGKRFPIDIGKHYCHVLPAPHRPGLGQAQQGVSNAMSTSGRPTDTEEQLPLYEPPSQEPPTFASLHNGESGPGGNNIDPTLIDTAPADSERGMVDPAGAA